MKKTTAIICLILSLIFLTSCSKENKGLVIEKAEHLSEDAPVAPEGYEYLEGVGSWLEPETEYISYPDENIISISSSYFSISNGNLYFQLKKEESKRDETGYYYTLGEPVYAYISNQTGEKHFICPDPLCTHGAYSGCQYLNLGGLLRSSDDASILYSTKTSLADSEKIFYSTIYEINTSTATITPIYTPDEKAEGLDSVYVELMFEKDGKLYFVYNTRYEFVNDNGETEKVEKSQLMSLELKTKQTEVLNDDFSTGGTFIAEVWDKLLFYYAGTKELYYTDYSFENPVTVFTNAFDYGLKNMYYDKNTDEIYILTMYSKLDYPDKADMSDVDIHCKVYKFNKDFNFTEVPMPSEIVTSIQLTKDYIYYTVFDPILLGTRNGYPIFDTTGGKIYRVARNNTTDGKLFFDGKEELMFDGAYCVIGDNLYLEYHKVRVSGDDMSKYYTGSIARVNVKENTLKWINLY